MNIDLILMTNRCPIRYLLLGVVAISFSCTGAVADETAAIERICSQVADAVNKEESIEALVETSNAFAELKLSETLFRATRTRLTNEVQRSAPELSFLFSNLTYNGGAKTRFSRRQQGGRYDLVLDLTAESEKVVLHRDGNSDVILPGKDSKHLFFSRGDKKQWRVVGRSKDSCLDLSIRRVLLVLYTTKDGKRQSGYFEGFLSVDRKSTVLLEFDSTFHSCGMVVEFGQTADEPAQEAPDRDPALVMAENLEAEVRYWNGQGEHDQASRKSAALVDLQLKQYGPKSTQAGNAYYAHGDATFLAGRHVEARKVLGRFLKATEELAYPKERVIYALTLMFKIETALEDFGAAERWASEAVEFTLTEFGAESVMYATSQHFLAQNLLAQGRKEEAKLPLTVADSIFQKSAPEIDTYATNLRMLATTEDALGEYENAIKHFRRLIAVYAQRDAPLFQYLTSSVLVGTLLNAGNTEEAAAFADDAIAAAPKKLDPESPNHFAIYGLLHTAAGRAHRRSGDLMKSESNLSRAFSFFEQDSGPVSQQTLGSFQALVEVREQLNAHSAVQEAFQQWVKGMRAAGIEEKSRAVSENKIRSKLSQHLQEKNEMERALFHARKGLATLTARGIKGAELIWSHKRIGEVLSASEDYSNARSEFLRAIDVALASKLQTEIPALKNLVGVTLFKEKQLEDAERVWLENLALSRKMFGRENYVAAAIYSNLGGLAKERSQDALAEEHYLKALEILEDSPSAEVRRHVVKRLGLHYLGTSQYEKSQPLLLETLQDRLKEHGEKNARTAAAFAQIAINERNLKRLADAEEHMLSALSIRKQLFAADSDEVRELKIELARIYESQGFPLKAADLLKKQGDSMKLGDSPTDRLVEMQHEGKIFLRSGDFSLARERLESVLELSQEHLGEDSPKTAMCHYHLASAYGGLGLRIKQGMHLLKALKIQTAQLGQDHFDTAATNNSLGLFFRDQNSLDLAMDHLNAAKKAVDNDESNGELALAIANNIVLVHQSRGDFKIAKEEYEPLLPRFRKVFGERSSEYGRALVTLGGLHSRADNNLQMARESYLEAWEILKDAVGEKAPEALVTAQSLASVHAKIGDTAAATDWFHKLNRNSRVYALSILPSLSVPERLAFLYSSREQGFHVSLDFASRARDEAQVLTSAAEWIINGKALGEEVLAIPIDRKTTEQNPHDTETESEGNQKWVAIAELQRDIRESQAVVDIIKYDENMSDAEGPKYVALLLRQQGPSSIKLVDLGDADTIDQQVRKVRAMIGDATSPNGVYRSAGEIASVESLNIEFLRLSQLIWDPIKKELPESVDRLVLSPDGALWLVPWAAMPISEEEVLLEKFEIEYQTSSRYLLRKSPQTVCGGGPIILGDPDFDSVRAKSAKVIGESNETAENWNPLASPLAHRGVLAKIGDVERLPNTLLEAKTASASLAEFSKSPVELYTRDRATESVVKAAHSPECLVLSTHGYFIPDELLRESESDHFDPNAIVVNPLLRCGLLLAGCNRRGDSDNGILTGQEVANLDLRNTRIVILSACDTAVGDVTGGEGVAGLRQAFQLAGAGAVVGAIWKVPDRDSALIMKDFYTNLKDGKPASTSLREAQLARIQARRSRYGAAHPLFWAAWVLTGTDVNFIDADNASDLLGQSDREASQASASDAFKERMDRIRQGVIDGVLTQKTADIAEDVFGSEVSQLSSGDQYCWHRLDAFCRNIESPPDADELLGAQTLCIIDEPIYQDLELAAYQDWDETLTSDETFDVTLTYLTRKELPRALHFAALRLSLGIGVDRDDDAAYEMFLRAREADSQAATLSLGHINAWGRGRSAGLDQARSFTLEAGKSGYGEAINSAFVYVDQTRTCVSYAAALNRFQRASESGSIWAGSNEAALVLPRQLHEELDERSLGRLRKHLFTAMDAKIPTAFRLYRTHFETESGRRAKLEKHAEERGALAAARGIPDDMASTGIRLIRDTESSPEDIEQGWKLLRGAASSGYIRGKHALGFTLVTADCTDAMRQEGLTILRELKDLGFYSWDYDFYVGIYNASYAPEPRPYKQAFEAFLRAAEDVPYAHRWVAYCYENGWGVEVNDEKYFVHMKTAAEDGDSSAMYWTAANFREGKGTPVNKATAFYWHRRAAELDDKYSQNSVGRMLKNGEGVQKNLHGANRWFKRAADNGNESAMWNLALNIEKGVGITKDEGEAFRLYELAASRDHAASLDKLGDIFRDGKLGQSKDLKRSLEYYRRAAELGDATAMNQLGIAYSDARGVDEDEETALEWYLKAAEADYSWGYYNAAKQYFNGEGTPKDLSKAHKLFLKAAEKGVVDAMTAVGHNYDHGRGVEEDDKLAFKWHSKAAETGDADACYNTGWMYMSGKGVPEDNKKAFEMFRRSAEKGMLFGKTQLGVCYWEGIGTEVDYPKAIEWFKKAADLDQAVAQYYLGMCYRDGLGVGKNLFSAKSWLKKSADQNNQDAAEALKALTQ